MAVGATTDGAVLSRPAPDGPGTPVEKIAAYVQEYEPAAFNLGRGGVSAQGWVDRWLDQFQEAERNEIAEGLVHLLYRHFVSRGQVARRCRALAQEPPPAIRSVGGWGRVTVPPWQQEGGSQVAVAAILGDALADAGASLCSDGEHPEATVYVDDLAVTGGRLGRDIAAAWKPGGPPVILLMWSSMATESDLRRQVSYWCDREGALGHYPMVTLQLCADREDLFVERIDRTPDMVKLAQHLRAKGAELIAARDTPTPPAFPLGFQPYESPDHPLGPGCPVVTWRNIPNSAPIALWWETDNWHPLFPRVTNRQTTSPHSGRHPA
jgi:hypothetical protein